MVPLLSFTDHQVEAPKVEAALTLPRSEAPERVGQLMAATASPGHQENESGAASRSNPLSGALASERLQHQRNDVAQPDGQRVVLPAVLPPLSFECSPGGLFSL